MAWDDNKDPEDLIRSNEWDTMVSDQKGHASRHQSGGIDEIDHNLLLNYIANEHIDHSTVNISAGTHLTGGGDITSSRTLNVDETNIEADNLAGSNGNAGQVLQTDGSTASWTSLIDGGGKVFVQNSQPTATQTDDVWIGTKRETSDLTFYTTLTDSSNSVERVAVSDDYTVYSGGSEAYVYTTGDYSSLVATLTAPTDTINEIIFDDDGSHLAIASADDNVYIYDTTDFTQISSSPLNIGNRVVGLGFDANYLAAGQSLDDVYIYDRSDYSQVSSSPITIPDSITSAEISSNAGTLAVGTNGNGVYLYNTSDFSEKTASPLTSASYAYGMSFKSDGSYLACGDVVDNEIYVFDTSDFTQISASPLNDGGAIENVDFGGGRLAGASRDSYVYIYDSSNFSLIKSVTDSTDIAYDVGLSGDGSYMVYGSLDNNAYVYYTILDNRGVYVWDGSNWNKVAGV